MKFEVTVEPEFTGLMGEAVRDAQVAVSATIGSAGRALQAGWRAQVLSAAFGQRLANTIRAKLYPKGRPSLGAASLVWTKAPEIVHAHDAGVLIRSKDAFWLAIPQPAAGSLPGNARMTPLAFERRTGLRLRFVYRRGRPSLLVVDDARISSAGRAVANRGKRRKDGILTGATTVVVFVLVPQVKLPKRLDLERLARATAERLPRLLAANWKE
jgi:hypothetical protein